MFKEVKNTIINYVTLTKKEQSAQPRPAVIKYLDSGYLQQAFTIFRSLPVVRTDDGLISASGIVERLKVSSTIKTINADLEADDILALIEIMFHTPRSVFLKSMSREPLLASLTPLPMYALKEQHGIGYEEWDKTDPKLKAFLGKQLSCILDYKDIPVEDIDLPRFRDYMTTAGNGDKKPFTAYPLRTAKPVDTSGNPILLGDDALIIPSNKAVVTSILAQIWLAHSSLRRPESMILDLRNWDKTPEPYDFDTSDVIAPAEAHRWQDDLVL